jgi:hypothetical protein
MPAPSQSSLPATTKPFEGQQPLDDPDKRTRIRKLLDWKYPPVPTKPGNPKQLAYRDNGSRQYDETHFANGEGVAIRTGQHSDGTYLCRLDLDSHGPEQDADAAYQVIAESLGPILAKCAVFPSTTGTGIDMLFKTRCELPNNQPIYIAGQHVGEVFCVGGRINLPDEAMDALLETLQTLDEVELASLKRVVTWQHGTRNPVGWSARADEGLALIRGYQEVNTARFRGQGGMPKTFVGTEKRHQIAQDNYRRLKQATKGQRSDAFARYAQSIMFLATLAYGQTIEEICRTVAALLIQDCPKAGEPNYDVEKDTAALIAKILHGDPYRTRPGHFRCPWWATEYRPEVRRSGRPKRDRQGRVARLRRLLNKHAEGMRVEHLGNEKLTVAGLARRLKVDRSTVQRYLQTLEENREILRDQVDGRNGRLVITLLPAFGHSMSAQARAGADSDVAGIPTSDSSRPTKGRRNSPQRAAETLHKGPPSLLGLADCNDLNVDSDTYILHRERVEGRHDAGPWRAGELPPPAMGDMQATPPSDDRRPGDQPLLQTTSDRPGAELHGGGQLDDAVLNRDDLLPLSCPMPAHIEPHAKLRAILAKARVQESPSAKLEDGEWNATRVRFIERSLDVGDFRAARLDAATIREAATRRAWLAYVDTCYWQTL